MRKKKKKNKMRRGKYEDGSKKPWMPDSDLAKARTAEKAYGAGFPAKIPNAQRADKKRQYKTLPHQWPRSASGKVIRPRTNWGPYMGAH